VYRRWLLILAITAGLNASFAALTNLFSTQFEAAQGYNANLDLDGQNGWTTFGAGGINCNGLVSGFFPGQGQQAYIGFTNGVNTLFLLRPINFAPLAAGLPLVKFTTLMRIEDSTNGEYDFFQWSVYNITGDRLFTLDFDNSTPYPTNINYALDGTNGYVSTGTRFFLRSNYTLSVTMNFASNRWSATLNSTVLATNLPMTTTGLPLTFGDVDAVWELANLNFPGDNYLVFDNYAVTAEPLAPSSPAQARLAVLSRSSTGQISLRLYGPNGSKFAVDASTNFTQWTALQTNLVSNGCFDYTDTNAPALTRRFYRARFVP